mmetsp:Transcript_12682/g.38229  ORF Transcript_12682/g.38229 Transcript_12682/m.38229 type:complete len:366 (+) Transcript_12682:867-1964(+)
MLRIENAARAAPLACTLPSGNNFGDAKGGGRRQRSGVQRGCRVRREGGPAQHFAVVVVPPQLVTVRLAAGQVRCHQRHPRVIQPHPCRHSTLVPQHVHDASSHTGDLHTSHMRQHMLAHPHGEVHTHHLLCRHLHERFQGIIKLRDSTIVHTIITAICLAVCASCLCWLVLLPLATSKTIRLLVRELVVDMVLGRAVWCRFRATSRKQMAALGDVRLRGRGGVQCLTDQLVPCRCCCAGTSHQIVEHVVGVEWHNLLEGDNDNVCIRGTRQPGRQLQPHRRLVAVHIVGAHQQGEAVLFHEIVDGVLGQELLPNSITASRREQVLQHSVDKRLLLHCITQLHTRVQGHRRCSCHACCCCRSNSCS